MISETRTQGMMIQTSSPRGTGGFHYVLRAKMMKLVVLVGITVLGTSSVDLVAQQTREAAGTYADLLQLVRELRLLEQPSFPNGVPDYTAQRMSSDHEKLRMLQKRLAAIDPTSWPIEQKVDYELVRAEMNGLDFHIRVLQPWARDPAFYALVWDQQSDTPAHEGTASHAIIDLWKYTFPLSSSDEKKLTAQLRIIPPFLEQARMNLTGNARDLWRAGIRNIRAQVASLDNLATKTRSASREFKDALARARAATVSFAEWLEAQASSKTGPSGVGKENYTWHLRHVLLVPLSWEEEVMLLQRELDRAYAMLALERHHNRRLPELQPIASEEEFRRRADQSVTKLMAFLKNEEVLPVKEYMEPALRKHMGSFQPDSLRNFFSKMTHLEPNILYTHATHWFDLAQMEIEPHPSIIRRDALPFNIWMSRSEGLATAVEEIFMHVGLYDEIPRARELVWIMLAQRCARGLASLYAQANMISLEEAQQYQIEWTPRGMMIGDPGLSAFEQQLYLRQPGYGTCYVTGKYLVDRLLKDRSRQLGDAFQLKSFFEEVYRAGQIPVSLIRWEITGLDDEIQAINKDASR